MSAAASAAVPTTGGDPIVSVLVVDDNASKRLALRAVLAPLGHEVVEADSGRAALRCVLAQQFAVILLDVRMPLMNGFETATIIRQRRESEFTPIIFITAHAADELGDTDRYADGAVDFLTAPVRPDELRAKVSALVSLFLQQAALESRSRDNESRADQWRVLLDNLPIGVFCTDEQGRCTYTNDEWTTMTGISPGDAIGRATDVLVARGDDGGAPSSELRTRHVVISAGPAAPAVTFIETTRALPAVRGTSAGWVGTLTPVGTEPPAVAGPGAISETVGASG